ncbi:branched-chain amino acid ABC transporter permease [Tepidimicrobium xylanilyticum]|uniref:Amino acid/amide ABC transporter membrane protein 2, HAAT family n=1 Tax=Tepidimicrobium xylanilyticum TaxID=1123352 RepID=A0A1H2W7E3_9FIRM|nr:branched-chain amino acid ABC transporter permease [Tepidimicrobium xylanilyticum]GMG95317.1 branched-chain amino acid ABC transporter permease [Tepidimicrobium xylanilyticum]SDW76461.1 amino acid/amide ABC transporter membrane protein 2, HAAT family [Tepidimicrobium xylanilyticum]
MAEKRLIVEDRKVLDKKTLILIGVLFILCLIVNFFANDHIRTIANLCGVYVTLGLSMQLINGFTGLFSLGHAGFMAVGAYTVAILTITPENKAMNFFLEPIVPFLADVQWSFLPALLMGGIIAALFGFLIGAPVLRLTDDYLAIATLGFAEIIRVVFTNTQSLTNGALGLKAIPKYSSILWSWIIAFLTLLFMVYLTEGSYGKAFKAIKEDEIAARSMGINLFKHKVMSFTFSSFLAGIGGGLMAVHLGTIDPNMFRITLTFNIILIMVLGGLGNINGTVISAIVVTAAMELLRFLDSSINLGFIRLPGIPGMRMVIFAIILMLVVIFRKDRLLKEN